jgi:hypothetical protein
VAKGDEQSKPDQSPTTTSDTVESATVLERGDLVLGTESAPTRDPGTDPTLSTSDPRGDLGVVTLDHQSTVDVLGAAPAGFTADQALPTGLDGKPIQSDPNHYGIGDNKVLDGHAIEAWQQARLVIRLEPKHRER